MGAGESSGNILKRRSCGGPNTITWLATRWWIAALAFLNTLDAMDDIELLPV